MYNLNLICYFVFLSLLNNKIHYAFIIKNNNLFNNIKQQSMTLINNNNFIKTNNTTIIYKKYPLIKKEFIEKIKKLNAKYTVNLNLSQTENYLNNLSDKKDLNKDILIKKYYLTKPIIKKMEKINSKNRTIQNNVILEINKINNIDEKKERIREKMNRNKNFLESLGFEIEKNNINNDDKKYGYFEEDDDTGRRVYKETKKTESKNFKIINNYDIKFKDIGGCSEIIKELEQCIDMLKNYTKYSKYNVRIPKGLILEGPPGTGKTLLGKALAGEANCSFIAVSGSDFQEKYIGVGSSRIKELFDLARKNTPCIIFIDEIDALGKKRSSDGDGSSSEKDSTLNALLVELDGFKNNIGTFVICATNRIDLLDNALLRPGRIDKKIYIGIPNKETRESIIKIHIKGKPHDHSIKIDELIEITEGLSGAEIENLLNEAMLSALKNDKTEFSYEDFDIIMNKMIAGWQPIKHEFTENMIDHIAIHEMGHALIGLLCKHHAKVLRVIINLSSPKSPGYTVFESSLNNLYTRESLFEHLMILLAGRIAEEVFYNISVTNGAVNDFEEALKLAEKMIKYYGMGSNVIYPSSSDKYKELIDSEVINLINDAYNCTYFIIENSKDFINETAIILKNNKIIKVDELNNIINKQYKYLENLHTE